MKFTNNIWFHTMMLVLIAVGCRLLAKLIAEIFGIEGNDLFLTISASLLTGFAGSFYFVKRVQRK